MKKILWALSELQQLNWLTTARASLRTSQHAVLMSHKKMKTEAVIPSFETWLV